MPLVSSTWKNLEDPCVFYDLRSLGLPWGFLVAMKNHCSEEDISYFLCDKNVTIGNRNKESFWDTLWVNELSPKVIAPYIYAMSKRKAWTVGKASVNDAWIL